MSKPTPKNEPAAYIGLALTVAVTVAGQFVHLSDGQWQPILAGAPLVAGLLARFFVSPSGRSVSDLLGAALADANGRQAAAVNDLAELQAAVAAIIPAPAPAPLPAPLPDPPVVTGPPVVPVPPAAPPV